MQTLSQALSQKVLPLFLLRHGKLLLIPAFLIYILSRRFKGRSAARALLLKAVTKRRQRDTLLHLPLPALTLSSEKQQMVLNASVTKLVDMLNNDEVTSEQVLLTFIHRVRTIGLSHELIADLDFSIPLQMAQDCDKKRQATPKEDRKKLGLLFGIPISIKDNFKMKGLDSTFGLAHRCNQPQTEDAAVIQVMKNHGAIPFVKSNGPQMMMTIESINHIWGRSKNPWNPERTVGGSSGGEAGLISARCSPLGLGTDIGGSVRIPALYCGVYTIKPTSERLSTKGLVYPNQYGRNGNTLIKTVVGPIGKCVEDVRTALKVLTSEDLVDLDPKISRKEWDMNWEEQPIKKMRIGYIDNDDFFEVSPANKRAVQMACEALKQKGHELINLKGLMPSHERTNQMYSGIFTSEGKLRSFFHALQGEPMIKEYSQWVLIAFMPSFLRPVLCKILKMTGQHRASAMLKVTGEKKAYELFEFVKDMESLKDEMIHIYKDNQIDAIITPGMALPAVRHGEAQNLYINACYTTIWNLVNFPTGAMPITKVQDGENCYTNNERKHKGDNYDKFAQSCLKGAVGLPVGVQLSTLPFEEEKCLAIMKEIEDVIGFHECPL